MQKYERISKSQDCLNDIVNNEKQNKVVLHKLPENMKSKCRIKHKKNVDSESRGRYFRKNNVEIYESISKSEESLPDLGNYERYTNNDIKITLLEKCQQLSENKATYNLIKNFFCNCKSCKFDFINKGQIDSEDLLKNLNDIKNIVNIYKK